MAKKKPDINCSTCFFSKRYTMDDDLIICRFNPVHRRLPRDHWCGRYLDNQVGGDLIQKPKDET